MAGQALELVIPNGFFILLPGELLVLVVLIVGLCTPIGRFETRV